ncbi:hypothetical protein GUJ93_ZPchr0011g27919 [Zizania palustris]|uniref:Uncharacterized protein n=1 Tax=Zizania palustris TaxID=103762 RepID=A0A8J5WKM0_ZIZPA|nr:hypothetical protein GUJ93_ZPchr0011g27919 [Zizania palustris]
MQGDGVTLTRLANSEAVALLHCINIGIREGTCGRHHLMGMSPLSCVGQWPEQLNGLNQEQSSCRLVSFAVVPCTVVDLLNKCPWLLPAAAAMKSFPLVMCERTMDFTHP